MNKSTLVAAAITGLMVTSVGCASSQNSSGGSADTAIGECHGVNSCKGQGECGGKGHSCAGKNSCKGQGWIKASKGDCEAKGGKFKAG